MAQSFQNQATRYHYIAKNIDGKTVKGIAVADDREDLYQQLLSRGLYLQSAAMETSVKQGMLKPKVLAEFCRQLSTLLAAGVNLARALSIIAQDEALSPRLRTVYEGLLADIREGISLSVALEAAGVFPELMLGMIRAGEGTGNLDEVADRLAVHYQKRHQLDQSVRSAMTYPAILCAMSVMVVIVIVSFVLPKFNELFSKMEQLPRATRVLMWISDFMVNEWYVLMICAALAVIGMRILLEIPEVRLAADRAKLKIPLFGRLNQVICTARFARTLSSLYSSGVPIVSALLTAQNTVGNVYIASQFDSVLSYVRSGGRLSSALGMVDGFVVKLRSTVQVGEETGQLDSMLESIADALEYDAEQSGKRMLTLLEPLLIVLMAAAVGFIMVAVMMPIISSYGVIESSMY